MESQDGKMTGTSGSETSVSTKLLRIAELARNAPEMVLTTPAHHIDIDWMREAYHRTRKDGALGVDGQSAEDYAGDLEACPETSGFAAGQLWLLDFAVLTTLPDGSQAISASEPNRIHKAIANAVCGTADRLSFEEFEFLCDITEATFSDAATYIGLNKSTVSTWRRRGLVPSKLVGNALKRWFWFKLFGASLGKQSLPISAFASHVAFLETASQAAIRANLSGKAVLKQAS